MAAVDHSHWGRYLLDAMDERREVAPISSHLGELSLDDGYAIQAALLELLLARGEKVAGAKLGLTSVAKQQQMGVHEPTYGWVLATSVLPADAHVSVGRLIHPRVEPELVFRLGEDLAGPGVTVGDVLDATEQVLGGIEVIDSRYQAFSFTGPDVVADNNSAALVAVGETGVAPREVDLTTVGCVFEVDGEITGTAAGAALLGDPAKGVALLANHLGRHGQKLLAGWIIPAGAPTAAQPLAVGATAIARYSHLGPVSVSGID